MNYAFKHFGNKFGVQIRGGCNSVMLYEVFFVLGTLFFPFPLLYACFPPLCFLCTTGFFLKQSGYFMYGSILQIAPQMKQAFWKLNFGKSESSKVQMAIKIRLRFLKALKLLFSQYM